MSLVSSRWGRLLPVAVLAFALARGEACPRAFVLAVLPMPREEVKDDAKVNLAVPDRNLVNAKDKNLSLDFAIDPDEKNVLWKAKLGKVSYAGPVIASGKVLVCTNNENPRDKAVKGDAGVVMCFDAKTGVFLWQLTHEKLDNDAINYPRQGIASTPFVDGNKFYYVSNRAELVCADLDGDPKNKGQGKILWTLDMMKDLGVFPCQLANSSPVVYGDLVFAVTGNGVDVENDWKLPAPDAPSFIAVNKNTGKLKWKDASPGKNIMEGQWTGPTIAHPKGGDPQVIFPGGDGWLYSFAPQTGKLIWKFNCNPSKAVYDHKTKRNSDKAYFLALPVVWEDRVYIGIGANPDDGPGVGHLWCIDPTKKGDVSPVNDILDPKDPKNKNSALVWHFGGKIVPEPDKGRKFQFGRTLSTCAIADGLLYIADLDGYFNCLDARTGKGLWEYDLRAGTWASPYIVDGKVFLGNDDGDLLVFEHAKKMKELAKITVGPPIKTIVRVIDGVLFVQTDPYLYAVKVK